MTTIYTGHTQIIANSDLDALAAQAAAGAAAYAVAAQALNSYPQTDSRTVASLASYLANNTTFNVLDYGAVADWNGTTGTDNATAFNNCAAALIASGGGVMTIPPGMYFLNSTVLLNVLGVYANFWIFGYGAVLVDGPSVSGPQVRVQGAANPFGVTIKGLGGYKTATGTSTCLISGKATQNFNIDDCTLEDNRGGGAGIILEPGTPGAGGTCCFWTRISRFSIRPFTGPSPFTDYGVKLFGAQNATNITDCNFTNCTKAVGLLNDGVDLVSVANGVLIDGNAFEGVTTCVDVVVTPAVGYWPDGLRVVNNRAEAATTFLSKTTGGGVGLNPSHPTITACNHVLGNVTTWLNNPTSAYLSTMEPSFFATTVPVTVRSANGFLHTTSGGNFVISSVANQAAAYTEGHLQLGETGHSPGHVWVDTGTGDLYYRFASAPTTATDGSKFLLSGNILDAVGTSPRLRLNDTDGPVNEKYIDFLQNGGDFAIRALDDTIAGGVNILLVTRTGTTIDAILLGSHTVPTVSATYDLGVSGTRWRNLWTSADATIGGKFGCNTKAAQAAAAVNVAAIDPATTMALVNQLRAALIANGIAV